VLRRAFGTRDAGWLVCVESRTRGRISLEYPECLCEIVRYVCGWLYHTAGIQSVSVDGVITQWVN